MIDFATWLDTRMKERKITALELSDETGYSDGTIRLWRNGKQSPRFDAFYDLVWYFGYDVELKERTE